MQAAPRENKSKRGGEKSTSQTSWHLLPLIYCSLLSMWFPPICFRCVFAFAPWKQTAFSLNYSLQINPPNTHTHTQVHTHKNNSSAALSLKDVTLTFYERYFWILAHTSCSVARRNGDKHLYVHTPPHTELMIDFTQIAEETNWHLNTLIQVWKHTHNHTRKNLPV